jgi:hypothetical protein
VAELYDAFEDEKAFAKILTCGNVLSKCENNLISRTASLSRIFTLFSQLFFLKTDKNIPPKKSNEIFGLIRSRKFISPSTFHAENGTISFGKFAVSNGTG